MKRFRKFLAGITASAVMFAGAGAGMIPQFGIVSFADTGTAGLIISNNIVTGYTGTETDIVIPNGVTAIADTAFFKKANITSISIPSTVTSIGERSFLKCTSLTSVTIPDSVTSIGANAFDNCSSLETVRLSKNISKISNYAFRNCPIRNLEIPYGVTYIGEWAFYGCSSLGCVKIPSSVQTIEYAAFQDCGLYDVQLSEGVSYIAGEAFSYNNIKDFVLPRSLKFIESSAVATGDTSWVSNNIYYCGSDSEWAALVGDAAGYYGDAGGKVYTGCTISNGFLLKDNTLVRYTGTSSSVSVPGNITSLSPLAFRCNDSVKSITIPDSVKTIGDYAFYGDANLTELNIPTSITTFGTGDYTGLSNLRNINYSGSESEWYNISNIANVKLPASTKVNFSSTKILNSISIKTLPRVKYGLGAQLDLTGGKLTLNFNDGSTQETDLSDAAVTGFNSKQTGTQTLTATYKNKTASFQVTVYKIPTPALTAVPGDGQVDLSWQAVEDATEYAVMAYCNGEYRKLAEKITGTSYTAQNLTNGTEYRFLILAYANGAWSEDSDSLYIPATPAAASVEAPAPKAAAGDGSVTLTWNAVTGADKYAVYICYDTNLETLTENLTKTTYTVSGLTNGTAYKFLVRACVNGEWSSGDSQYYVSATPKSSLTAVPPTVTAVPGDGKVTLSWGAIEGATKYYVSIVNDDGTFKTVNSACKSTSVTVEELANGTEYTFLVQSYVNKKWSSSGSKYFVKATPSGSSSTVPAVKAMSGDSKVTLMWNAIDGATKYYISIANDDGTFTTVKSAYTGTEITVNNLTNGREYNFLVQAYVNKKWSSSSSRYFVSATPRSPLSPVVTATPGSGRVTLSWAPIDGATKYYISIANDDGTFTTVKSSYTKTEITVKGLTNGTEYNFLVQAYVNKKWSSSSSENFVKATPKAANVPDVTAVPGDCRVTLSWTPVEGATKYYISIANDDGTFKTVKSSYTGTSLTVKKLTNGTEYNFLVQSYVNGKWSSSSSVYFTKAAPVSTAPAVTATPGSGKVTLSWNAINGAEKYYVSIVNDDGTFKTVKSSVTATKITVSSLESGKTYRFLVQSYVNGKWSSSSSKNFVSATVK